MHRASSLGYKSFRQSISAVPRPGGLPKRAKLPRYYLRTASIHDSAAKLYPRKSSGNLRNIEEGFDSASIQELIDKDDNEDNFDPALFLQRDSMTGPSQLAQSEDELFSVDSSQFGPALPPISPLPSGLDPRKLPVKIDSLTDLGPNPTEEAYASALVHGRSIHLPYIHPRTHSIPAGNITFYSYHPRLLALFTHFASHAASSLAIPISKVIMLPTERSLWTVIRAPFAYKKSQENFERRTHKRMIKAWDADPEVIDRWVKYIEKHSMGGVGIRVTKWERLPLGIGKTRLARTKEAFKAPKPEGVSSADVKLLEVQQEGDSGANRKQAIQALGNKILKEELQTLKSTQKSAAASTAAVVSGSSSALKRTQSNTSGVKQQAQGSRKAPTVSAKGTKVLPLKSVPEQKAPPSSKTDRSSNTVKVTAKPHSTTAEKSSPALAQPQTPSKTDSPVTKSPAAKSSGKSGSHGSEVNSRPQEKKGQTGHSGKV